MSYGEEVKEEYPKETIHIHIRDNDNKPIEGAKVPYLLWDKKYH